MKNVCVKNKFLIICAILLIACKEDKTKSNLSFDIDFSKIGYGKIEMPMKCNDNDSLMTIRLNSKDFNKPYIITRKIGTCKMPIKFMLFNDRNNNITFLIEQIYSPFDDSLVFIKTKNGFKFKAVYNNTYSPIYYKNYIEKGRYKQKGNLIELINNVNYP
ncbi:hypothetical protein ACFSJW_21260 [Flavobacterium artemisiae]|uniref:Lipoprotein n=1 Tax=Flavobacterium artemisiae TaxID=2126556 RepID=A0ABW4HAJ9_9FLAO